MRPRIALIHATPVAIDPIIAAFRSGWPQAEPVNILDDSLTPDRAKSAALTPAIFERFRVLTRYARDAGAAGILFTCSAFGEAIDRAASETDVPVLKPNEAMFEQALARGARIGMVATFAPAVEGMEGEFEQAARARNPRPTLETVVADGAMDALRSGDEDTHNRLVAEAAAGLAHCDAIMLAHFSTSRAVGAARSRVAKTVLTSPDAAVARLRSMVKA